jgi:hypothetical protein
MPVSSAHYYILICSRHRFTATYLSNLIQNHFQSPHKLLDHFIFSIAAFQPLDAVDFKRDEPEWNAQIYLDRLHGFDFSRIKGNCITLPARVLP